MGQDSDLTNDVAPLPGFPEDVGMLAAQLEETTDHWLTYLSEELPAEATAWRVHQKMPSIGALYLKLLYAEVFWVEKFFLGKEIDDEFWSRLGCDSIDVNEDKWPDVSPRDLLWYLELHEQIRDQTLESLKGCSSAEQTVHQSGKDCSLRWVLNNLMSHEAVIGGRILSTCDL